MPNVVGAGKKLKSEWSEVLSLEGKGTSKVSCRHCNIEISAKIGRIRAHLKVK
jgi:hypothetical protein